MPMQETRVQSTGRSNLLWATGPVHHNYWACALESKKQKSWSQHHEKPLQWEAHTSTNSPHSLQLEKALTKQWRPRSQKLKTNKQKNMLYRGIQLLPRGKKKKKLDFTQVERKEVHLIYFGEMGKITKVHYITKVLRLSFQVT